MWRQRRGGPPVPLLLLLCLAHARAHRRVLHERADLEAGPQQVAAQGGLASQSHTLNRTAGTAQGGFVPLVPLPTVARPEFFGMTEIDEHLPGVIACGAEFANLRETSFPAASAVKPLVEPGCIGAMSEAEFNEHRATVLRIDETPVDLLKQLAQTCGTYVEPKSLGDSASSSRSGAKFYKCGAPGATSARFIVKGGVRATDWSPEWQTLGKMAKPLSQRLRERTLLNRVVLGFDAFGQHWVVLEDVGAAPLTRSLASAGVFWRGNGPKWSAFDIKPAGSRSPQLPECLQELHAVARVMGPVNTFHGWGDIRSALAKDMAFLKSMDAIDESLFVQVAGPAPVMTPSVDIALFRLEQLKTFGKSPMCAYQVKGGLMAIVCVTILDYLLSMSPMKVLQNVVQGARWNNYEAKVGRMLDCLGDLNGPTCKDYKNEAEGHWRLVIEQQYQELEEGQKEQITELQKTHSCCCNTSETRDEFAMDTTCAWIKRQSCPDGLEYMTLQSGGCLDLEPADEAGYVDPADWIL